MKTYQLFVGSNNATGKLETDRIIKTTSKAFQGFTLSRSVGYWQGKPEKSAIVTIAGARRSQVDALAANLKKVLQQDAVMVMESGAARFV